jgi:thiol-disulfide isomerase/thioredoxin
MCFGSRNAKFEPESSADDFKPQEFGIMLRFSVWLFAGLVPASQLMDCQPVNTRNREPTAGGSERYHRLLTRSYRQTFDEISRYCREHADAPDNRTALQDLSSLARTWGWEADARAVVEPALSRDGLEPALMRDLLAVTAIGAARTGDRSAAAAAFERFLKSLRLRNPNEATDLAQSLALVWQLRGDREGAAAVYEQVSSAFLLNPEVRDFAAARTRRLELIGQPMPELGDNDLTGRPVTAADFAGKVVLFDFWATNCRPCLEELPRLRAVYRDCQPHGLEVIGLSFDEDRAAIDQFLTQEPLPWRLALGRKTAEDRFHVHLIPCLILADRQGRIVATDVRPFDLRRTVETLLDQRP